MGCYCKAQAIKDPQSITKMTFEELALEVDPEEDYRYCRTWAINFALQNGMVVGSSMVVVAINVITCTIFEMIVRVERKHSVNEETNGQFTKITLMQFINIAIVVLCVNFDFIQGDGLFLGFIPIFNGAYPDFTVSWYAKVGKTLCMTLLIAIFSPYASKMAFPALKLWSRMMDRGCCKPLQKEGEDDAINTKKTFQYEVNELYTGDQISGHYVYA